VLSLLPAPYRLAGVVLGLVLLAGAGYIKGRTDGADIAAGQGAELARVAADRARQLATLDTAEAIAAEQARAAARRVSLRHRHALDQDIARVGARACGLDADSFRLLNDRIGTANTPPAPSRSDGSMPPDPATR
jgi:hypothetical protein